MPKLVKLTRMGSEPVYVNPEHVAYVTKGAYPGNVTRITFVGERGMSLDVLESLEDIVALLTGDAVPAEDACVDEIECYLSKIFPDAMLLQRSINNGSIVP